jgi:hypothetical protein
MSRGIKTLEQDRLVANNACRSIGSFGVNASRIHVDLCARHKEATRTMHGIKFARIGTKGHLDISQALAPSQLSKHHHSKLFRTGHAPNTYVAAVAVHYSCKTGPRDEFHQLGKKCLSNIHDLTPRSSLLGKHSKMKDLNSNRHQIKLAARPHQY